MRLARGSARYLTGAALLFLLAVGAVAYFGLVALPFAALIGILLLFVVWFFRDPERLIAEGVVSPADGKVLHVHEDETSTQLTIFMSPHNVHVNRAPMDGRVEALTYYQGSHVPAFNKESARNERLEVDLTTPHGPVRVRLIAGTVARRIHPYLTPGVDVKKGERIGLIAFGSRCELVLPPRVFRVTVAPGQWILAGKTTVAREVV